MRRRQYIQYLTSSVSGFAGCTGLFSIEETNQSHGKPAVKDNRAFISYNTKKYRDVFDYESIRSKEELTDSPARGGKALKVPIPEGKHRGMRMRFWFDNHFGLEPEEASATYWLYVPSDFEFVDGHDGGGKLPGFQGTYGECGAGDLGPCDGTNGWSARMSFIRPEAAYLNTDFGLAFYVYHGDMAKEPQYPYGAHIPWNSGLQFDQWHRIDQYVRMNTPGTYDGILGGWVNRNLAFYRDGLLFRAENNDDIRIEEFVNTVYFGGDWSSPKDNNFYFDNLEIRIGAPNIGKLEEDE